MSESRLTFTAEDAEQKHGWLPWYAYNYSKDISERLKNPDLSDKEVYEFQDKASKVLRKIQVSQARVIDEENKAWTKAQTRREVDERIQAIRDSGDAFETFDVEEEIEKIENDKEVEQANSLISNLLNKKKK